MSVRTHGHFDHIQNRHQFGTCYLNTLDLPMFANDVGLERTLAGLETMPAALPRQRSG